MSFFTIDVSELAKPSKKPRFLSMRFRSLPVFGQDAESRKRQVLNAKTQKLREHHLKIEQAQHKSPKMTLDRLQKELDSANARRLLLLERKQHSCSNNVKRAKLIAKLQRKSSLMERLSKQKRIDEKLRLSELRRRGVLKEEDEAAYKIQNWYRRNKWMPLVRVYAKIGLSRAKALQMGFEQLVKKVTNPTLIKLANFVVLRGRKMNNHKQKLETPGKVLLSAFCISCYPQETLGKAGEFDLASFSSGLVHHVEAWLTPTLDTEYILPLGQLFYSSFMDFYNAFNAWKRKDSDQLILEFVQPVCDLDRLWLKVRDQVDAETEWAPNVTNQFNEHLLRIKKLGKQRGVEMLKEKRLVVMNEAGLESDISLDQSPVIIYPIQVASDAVNSDNDMDIDEQKPTQEELKQFGSLFTNEHLAHELVMDPDFKLQKPKLDPNTERITMIAKRAFTDKLREDIENNSYGQSVLGLIMEFKDGLLDMLDKDGGVYKEIAQALEKEYLFHQMKHNVFDLEKTLAYIGSKMKSLCAPVRDAALRNLESETDIATIMMGMSEILEDMKLDMSNFRLQAIKPNLVSQAVEYERSKFNNALADGRVQLEKTQAWLVSTVSELNEKRQSRNPENVELPKLGFESVYNTALMRLLIGIDAVNPQTVPETLLLDCKRVYDMQNEIQALTIVSALTMLSQNLLPTLKRNEPGLAELTKTLFAMLQQEGTNVATLAKAIIEQANTTLHLETKRMADLSKFTTTQRTQELKMVSQEQEELVRNMVEKTLSFKDPFFLIIHRRIEKAIRVSLDGTEFTLNQAKKMGLEMVFSELQHLVNRIVLLAKHNKKVYAEHYDSILFNILQ